VLKLISRRRTPTAPTTVQSPAATSLQTSRQLPTADTAPGDALDGGARVACALSACLAGERATVLEVRCGDLEACRLRTLGLCEGAAVNVVRARDCTLLEVRGSRLAVSHSLASSITVLPVA